MIKEEKMAYYVLKSFFIVSIAIAHMIKNTIKNNADFIKDKPI